MKISIIVPIYKIEEYIKQCVDSIIAQSYTDLEIILVDDGSPDNCPKICDKYAEKDSRVKVLHKQNGGLMSARQAGLKIAAGEYVGFVDGDDWIEPNMYEKFANLIDKYKPDMAMCEFLYSYPERDEKSSQLPEKEFYDKTALENEIYPKLLFRPPYYNFGINPCCWSKVLKKELLENNLYNVTEKIKIGEDAAFTYPCLLQAKSLAYCGEYLYHYRINQNSMTKSYDKNMEDTIMIPYEILKKVFSKYNGFELDKQLDYFLLSLINGIARNEANPKNKKSIKDKKATFKKFTTNEDVVNAAKSIDYSILPLHTKLYVKSLALKSPNLLYLYSLLLRRFL
ncbi:MAG: glycosyltransferase family 2 protein [Eubacterium sp.]